MKVISTALLGFAAVLLPVFAYAQASIAGAVSREVDALTGSATASVNADMRVGSLEETITVTGESAVVDLQSAERQTVLTNEVIKAIPTAGSYNALLVLVPGLLGGSPAPRRTSP